MYYKIWVDAIIFEKIKYGKIRNWKFYTLLPISLLNGFNLLSILILLSFFNIRFEMFIHFNIFHLGILNALISGFITFLLPFIILNYFLIFRNKRYDKLIEKYEYKNGRLYLIYFLITVGALMIPLVIKLLLQ